MQTNYEELTDLAERLKSDQNARCRLASAKEAIQAFDAYRERASLQVASTKPMIAEKQQAVLKMYHDAANALYTGATAKEGERLDRPEDVDLCEFNGKTVIYYSWGTQSGNEFLAQADYDGPMAEFFKRHFLRQE
jgi:hypothetical protein